jgi:acyl-[acyl carrier protein]--UDP-N-acetylglucosamine O-acyltransferase
MIGEDQQDMVHKEEYLRFVDKNHKQILFKVIIEQGTFEKKKYLLVNISDLTLSLLKASTKELEYKMSLNNLEYF